MLILVALLVFLLRGAWSSGKGGSIVDKPLRSWLTMVKNPTDINCYDGFTESLTGDEVLSVVDCDDEGAQPDHTYTGHKILKQFSADGLVLTTASRSKEEGRCVKPFSGSVDSIFGLFRNDQLEGNVRINFKDGSFMLSSAELGRLNGIQRYFDSQ